MHLNKDSALLMESCLKQIHREMTYQKSCGKILELHEGIACFAGASSFFSQVYSWGFSVRPKDYKSQIQAIEQFYCAAHHPVVDIQLCSLLDNDLFIALGQRGYQLTDINNVSYLNLHKPLHESDHSPFRVTELPKQCVDEWAYRVALGYGRAEAQEQFASFARLKEVTIFGVVHQDKIIAGSALALHQGVADLGVCSTLSPYRNKGIQKLMVQARLNYAKLKGAELAVVTTEPGTVSDLNLQKRGFKLAYVRLKMSRLLVI